MLILRDEEVQVIVACLILQNDVPGSVSVVSLEERKRIAYSA